MTTRKPTAVRRREIARAALEIIGRRGVRALTTATLAKQVGVTTGTLFRHYDSLADVYVEIVRYAAERLEATCPDASLAPWDQLRALALGRIELLRREPGIAWLLRSAQAAHLLPQDAARALEAVVRASRNLILELLERGAEAGAIRRDLDPRVLLVPFTATIHQMAARPSVQQRASTSDLPEPPAVIDGLLRLLAPPGH